MYFFWLCRGQQLRLHENVPIIEYIQLHMDNDCIGSELKFYQRLPYTVLSIRGSHVALSLRNEDFLQANMWFGIICRKAVSILVYFLKQKSPCISHQYAFKFKLQESN